MVPVPQREFIHPSFSATRSRPRSRRRSSAPPKGIAGPENRATAAPAQPSGPSVRGRREFTRGRRPTRPDREPLLPLPFENLTPTSFPSPSPRLLLLPCLACTRPPLSFSSSHGPHGRRLRPPRHGHGQARASCPVSVSIAGPRRAHPPPRLLLPDAQLGLAPPPPLRQGRRLRLRVPAAAPAHAVPREGEAPGPAAGAARRRPHAPAVEPPHPPLRHLRAARGGIGRRGEGHGGGGWGAGAAAARVAAGGAREEGILRRAHQGRDRRGLRRHPRHAPAAPAQEAPARRPAPARPAVPGIVSRRRQSGLVQDRGEVIGLQPCRRGGAANRMNFSEFPAFAFFTLWLTSPPHDYSSSCRLEEGGMLDLQC